MVLLLDLMAFLCSGASMSETAADDAPSFSHVTVASHVDGSANRWPCMARLADGRLLVVWSQLATGAKDDAIVAAFSVDHGATWGEPERLIANEGLTDADPSIVVSGERVWVTCTSVSFAEGIRTSATWCVRSEDNAATWSEPYEIPMGHRYTCGKTHRGLRLESGTLLMGYSWDVLCEQGTAHQGEGEMDLRAGVMRSTDNGETWVNGGDTHATYERVSGGAVSGTDEPALVELDDGSIYMLMRTGADHLYQARSTDDGQTWQGVGPSPLYGSNAPAALSAFEADGRRGIFVVWDNALRRYPLCAAASFDHGRTWTPPRDIGHPYTGGGQASYPSCVQAADGTLLAVWQQDVPGGRDVRCARFSPAWLIEAPEPRTTVVLFGDSTTAPRGPLRIFAQLLSEALPDAKVINAGIGSNTTDMARKRFERDVLAHDPDVVTVFFGLNDAAVDVWKGATEPRVPVERYQENLRHFVEVLRERGATAVLMAPNPLAWTDELRKRYGKPPYNTENDTGFNVILSEYVVAVRALAKSENVPLIDVNRIFLDCAEAEGHSIHDLLLDGMHPNDQGHRLIADALLAMLALR